MMKCIIKRMLLLMVIISLYGCGRDGQAVLNPEEDPGGQQKIQAMGRYVESEVLLPEGITYDSVLSFKEGPEGRPMLLTRNEKDGMAEFSGYLLNEDSTWEEKACGWLNQLGLTYEYGSVSVTYGEDHKLYAVYSEEEDQERIARHHVVVSEDWENSREIEIPALLEINELGYAYFPRSITALSNGNLLFESGKNLYLYDASGQQRIAELLKADNNYFVHDNQFYIIDGDSGNLVRYDGKDGTEKARFPLELEDYYGVRLSASDNGDLSVITKEGIQILKNGSGIWERIVEGTRTTMGSPKYYITGFMEGGQEDYYVCYGSMDETCKLTHYVYRPDMPVEPETELTIFSLYDNDTIRQGISEFQIKNPNTKIDFQPLMEDGSTEATEDYIRSLNAELLSGAGPDILILDGLSERSYIEKGILEDLTTEIESLVSTGGYLANIADTCRVEGNIYAVPVKIGLPLTFGRKEALKEAGQLSSLADFVQRSEPGEVFGVIDRTEFLALYADAFLTNIVSKEGVLQDEELKEFLTNMKRILDGSGIADGTQENRPTNIWGLLESGTTLYSDEIAGFFESGEGTSIIEQAEGELETDMILINETYLPYGTIGINKSSKNKDLAIHFLQTVLSEEVQSSDFYDGFAVNQNALDFLCETQRNSADGYGGTIQGTDGRTYEFKFGWPDESLRRRLVDFCKTVKHSAGSNWKVKEILLEYSAAYFDGTSTLEETVKELTTKITLHLQE